MIFFVCYWIKTFFSGFQMDEDLLKIGELTALIRKLRSPEGCPWDRKQKKEDIGKYILEEAYEVADSLAQQSPQALKEELGDLLFQILFLTEISAEEGSFSLNDVADEIIQKMIRRHPHVFGDEKVDSVEEVKENWQKIKTRERATANGKKSLLDSVPLALPALKRAQKITAIASQYGFDWSRAEDIVEKLREELGEFDAAIKAGEPEKAREEMGDVFFTLVNLSRFHAIDAETALSRTTGKFLRRFHRVLDKLADRGIEPGEATLAQMDALWDETKREDEP
ncbi:MAG TPA: nucleoside triphosphate pyrophosphohydrolase [Smithella sp.]|nr:nucleoside triphosphate pyrophosphohydrolase [Smithella sp.]